MAADRCATQDLVAHLWFSHLVSFAAKAWYIWPKNTMINRLQTELIPFHLFFSNRLKPSHSSPEQSNDLMKVAKTAAQTVAMMQVKLMIQLTASFPRLTHMLACT